MLTQDATPQAVPDSLATPDASTAYDSIWTNPVPEFEPTGFEAIMLSQDKIYVVLGVVLLIWIGISYFLLRTDRKLDHLERAVDARIPDSEDDL